MKSLKCLLFFNLAVLVLLTGCNRFYSQSCEEHYTEGHHWEEDSKQVHTREEFMSYPKDYIPLVDEELSNEISMSHAVVTQAEESPGDPGSPIPGVDGFKDPMTVSDLREVFKTIRFPYDSDLIKGENNLKVVREISSFLKNHSATYIFIEGHCDERGAEAYNLALGSRRSNSVRHLLVKEGVDPNQIFTVSYGKERPIAFGHNEEAWKQNRRTDFKIFQR